MLGSGLWGACTLVSWYFCISGVVIIIILCIGLVVRVCVCVCVHAQLLSRVQLFVAPWTVAHQAPLSVGFSRQEYQSGLPFPSLGDLHDPGMKPSSPALAGGFFTTEPSGKPHGTFNVFPCLWYLHSSLHIICVQCWVEFLIKRI